MTELNNNIENYSNYTSSSTPQNLTDSNDMLYNCTKCSSLTEILSINEDNNIIEFQCLNKECNDIKTMPIKEYLEKIEKNKIRYLNEDTCREHISCKNNKYVSYCFNCNCHLCEECLKTRAHIFHNKTNIIEIKPIEEELEIIKEVLEYYEINIENLKNEKINKIKELDNLLNIHKINENKKIKNKIETNEHNKSKELEINHNKYLSDIKEIKMRYENEIKDRKNKYRKDEDKINAKYKIINEKDYIIHQFKIEKLEKKYKEILNSLAYDKKIDNMINIKKISEIVYNTYNFYNNNYFNSININNILLSYFKNDYIKNNIIKRVLNNKYEEIIKLILKKEDEVQKINLRKEKEENENKIEKEKIDLKIKEIKEEYEKKIKEINEEKERLEYNYKKVIQENSYINEKYREINEEMEEKEEKMRKDLEIEKRISYKFLIFSDL